MREIVHNPADAILLGAALAFFIQFMASRENRLKAGRFILFALLNIASMLFATLIPVILLEVSVWFFAAILLSHLFYRIAIFQTALYVSAFVLMDIIGQFILHALSLNDGQATAGGAFQLSSLMGNIEVVLLSALFLFAWNFLSSDLKHSQHPLLTKIRARLENASPTNVGIVFIFLMITISMLGIMRIYNGILQDNFEKVKNTFYILFLLLPVLYLSGFFLYKLAIRNQIIVDKQKKEYEQLLLYTGIIEKLTKDMRSFRHDFNNILLTLRGFIEQDDQQKLRDYYFSEILGNQSVLSNEHSVFLDIEYIRCIPLKGLLTTVFQRALNQNLNVSLLIDGYLDDTGIKDIDLCRMMGVFLDNAVEAAADSKDRILSVSILQGEQRNISIIIANSFARKPDIDRLFQGSYSTKGADRGTGLPSLQDIMGNYEHVTLNTVIENGLFFQELNIANDCRQ